MATIEILDRGTIDGRNAAFPQVVELPNGDLLASYSNHGGQFADGGTDWSRSTDGGRTWQVEGTLLPATADPESTNYLKPSLSPDGRTIYAYGARSWGNPGCDVRVALRRSRAHDLDRRRPHLVRAVGHPDARRPAGDLARHPAARLRPPARAGRHDSAEPLRGTGHRRDLRRRRPHVAAPGRRDGRPQRQGGLPRAEDRGAVAGARHRVRLDDVAGRSEGRRRTPTRSPTTTAPRGARRARSARPARRSPWSRSGPSRATG